MPSTSTLHDQLVGIQKGLKVPKNQNNSFGNYKYRSCEDILEAVKQLLGTLTLVVSDEMVGLNGRYYVKATATLSDGKDSTSATAYAREADEKKGMDAAQITGAASSYARKYALNGLFAIDDTKDPDTDEAGKADNTAFEGVRPSAIDRTANSGKVLCKACGRFYHDSQWETCWKCKTDPMWFKKGQKDPINEEAMEEVARTS